MKIKLFDSHCHLQVKRLPPAEDFFSRAGAVGVEGYFCCATDPGDWADVKQLAAAYPGVIPGFGIHPWYIRNASPGWQEVLEEYIKSVPSFVGEVGLDLATDPDEDPLEVQEAVFLDQLKIALKYRRPMNIHCRKAWHRLTPLLRKHWDPGLPVIIHSFSGTADTVKPLAQLGAYFSFSGSLTKSGNNRVRKALQAVPRERILLETDSPDIPPVINHEIDYDTPNEPANIVYVLKSMAALLEIKEEEAADIAYKNSIRIRSFIISGISDTY